MDTECSGSIIQIASATHVVVHDIVTQPRSRVADLKAILENKHILKVFFASVDDVKHLRALGIDVWIHRRTDVYPSRRHGTLKYRDRGSRIELCGG